MSILCATDFSPRDATGVHAAAALARKLHDPIDLVHVIEPIYGELHDAFFEDLRRTSEQRLEREASELREEGADVRTHLPIGAVTASLDDFVTKEKPQLVVVSARGRTAPDEWLLGSTAERTAERVHAPTLVVRNARPLEAWARGERPLKVLVACDFTLSSRAALSWARKLAGLGPCEIVAARVVWLFDESARLGGELPTANGELGAESRRALLRDLADWVQPLIGDMHPELHCLTSMGRLDFRLIEFAEQNDIDLIVTGARQQRGMRRLRSGSFSRGLLRYAPMNVACIPASEAEPAAEGGLSTVERVLVATDFSDPADRALAMAYEIVAQGGQVQLVTVLGPGREYEAEEQKNRLREHIPAVAEELNIDTDVTVVTGHDIAQAICNQAERFGAHVICVGTHGSGGFSRTLLGSVAHDVAARSSRPVLLAPHYPE